MKREWQRGTERNEERARDAEQVRSDGPAPATIAERAYQRYLAHGEHGRDMEDWLAAEAELRSAPRATRS